MELHINLDLLRHFLRTSNFRDPNCLMQKAVENGDPGAVQMLLLCIKVRANHRTRRTWVAVRGAYRSTARPRWYNKLAKQMFNLYRLLRSMCVPTIHAPTTDLNLSLRQQRVLSTTGTVRFNRETIAEAASRVATKLFRHCHNKLVFALLRLHTTSHI